MYVQYIRNPGYFVVLYEEDIPKIEQLSEEINNKCDSKPLRTEKQLQPGQFVYFLLLPWEGHFVVTCVRLYKGEGRVLTVQGYAKFI